jgi:hypothetical protein
MSKDYLTAARSYISQGFSWRRAASAAVLLASFGFLGYKAYTSWDALKNYDWQIRYEYLIPSFLLFLLQLVIITLAWQSIMNCLAQRLPFREHIKIYGYTNLMRRIPAGALWVVAGRAHAYRSQNVPARSSAVGSLLEIYLVVLTGLPAAALAASGLNLLSPTAGTVLAIAALIVELIALHPRILGRLIRLNKHQSIRANLTYRYTLAWAGVYTLIWLVSGIGLFLIGCLFTALPLESLPSTIGIWVLSSLIAYLTLLSPSGLGVKELSLTVLLGILLPNPLPLLIALATRLVWTVYDLVIGAVAWLL